MPPPETHIHEWADRARDAPSEWAALIRAACRACRSAWREERRLAAWRQRVATICHSGQLPLPDTCPGPEPPPDAVWPCECGAKLATKAAWRRHRARAHEVLAPARRWARDE
eukprot:3322443-Lingulodinium_polyedra.AAC.1